MNRVACLVVNYFSAQSVGALLDSFARVELPDSLQIIIVDNSCDDAEWQRLEDVAASRADAGFSLLAVRSESNQGYAGGNNFAFESAGEFDPDVVFVINPDVVVDSGSLITASAEVAGRPNCVSGALTMHRGASLSGLGSMNPWTGAAKEIPLGGSTSGPLVHPMGHFLALRADTWRSLGGLSEDFFLFCEELDLTLRLRAVGGRVDVLDSIVIEHEKGLTTGAVKDVGSKATVSYRHATRSRVVLYRSHPQLKKYLLPMIAARLAWSLGLLVSSGPAPARAVLLGLRDGLVWKRAPR